MSCTLWQLMDCLLIMVCIKLMRFICVHKVICIPLAIFGFNEIHLCLMIFMVGGVPVSSRTSIYTIEVSTAVVPRASPTPFLIRLLPEDASRISADCRLQIHTFLG